MRRSRGQQIGYVAALAACFLVAMAAGWTTAGVQLDNNAYDFLFRLHCRPAPDPESVLLAIDERTLMEMGGMRRVRSIVAGGLERIAAVGPKAVVVDLILADEGDATEDARLEAAFARTPNLALACDLIPGGWEDPLPRFRRSAAAVGHVHADPDPLDNVTRRIPLEKASPLDRRWALALEALRLARGADAILETPRGLEVDGDFIPAPRRGMDSRSMLVRYFERPEGAPASLPSVSFLDLESGPEAAETLRGKVVFVGVTAQSAADDRHMTPYSGGRQIPGVEIHASAFETMARGTFLEPVSDSLVLLFCLALAVAAGLTFAFQAGWRAYLTGALLLGVAHAVPVASFREGLVFPYAAPLSTAWLCLAGAATYQHFVVRRLLRTSESARSRYQQAIQFVTHEMRTPLTAIQGSSELMGRYRLGEEKSRQLAQMINAESKRLARMIQTFLDVERLTDGQMEIKREPFQAATIVETCLERVRPLAERKRIAVRAGEIADAELSGDRELMEYAVYNLLTNAIKYSPAETEITVSAVRGQEHLRLSVRDQGIGMDETELRNIFRKFYRTRRAEASGEAGTGIGLSIVEQIVTHHGGKMEVTSKPGAGSCFTMVLPAAVSAGRIEAK
jgi:signal transduction histidine kinase